MESRPRISLTDDGRPLAELRTYARRGSRFSPRQRGAWERRADQWVIPDEAVDDPAFSLHSWFGREAPLIVEIGSGVGEATAALAAARPTYDVLAFEVWRPGVADTLAQLEQSGATNVRLISVDAVWSVEHLLGQGSVSELWTFFPDPWPKKKHHRRRLVTPSFAALVASRLAPAGEWRLATDWPDYAQQMQAVLDAEPALEGGRVDRWAERPVTKFERRGVAEGRPIADYRYSRRP
ncbi:MAG TPA: tRNA (guanosine(46)-N7)-methyltransferase TrmB [Nocardioidaceae bacterium]|nr:tRNA (guanosine(46)-N7)-methyltransferase TrmB [Nocardioidaceae bacterium]